jgi:hypothetical protein
MEMKALAERHRSYRRHRLGRLSGAIAATLALGVVVTWSWNTIVPELASGPEIRFKHALALLALTAAAGWLLRGGRRRY